MQKPGDSGRFLQPRKQNDILRAGKTGRELFREILYEKILNLILTIIKKLILPLPEISEHKLLLQQSYQIIYRPTFTIPNQE